jgi:hypothetical protein
MNDRDEPTTATDSAEPLDTELPMTQHHDPTADPTADPVVDPTLTIETVHTQAVPTTQAVPEATPFRVEPATPVPDDVTRDTPDLSHLPPPSVEPAAPAGAPTQQAGGCGGDRPWSHASHRGHAHVTVRKGPRPGAVVLGLLSMLVAAYVIAVNVSDASLDVRLVGPALVGALGGLLLLVGLAGVLIGRLRR